MLEETSGQLLIKHSIGLWWDVAEALSGGKEISNGIRKREPTSVLDVEKT